MKLKKCPCCGGFARIDIYWNGKRKMGKLPVLAKCSFCGHKTTPKYSEQEAAEAWNTSPQQVTIFELLGGVAKDLPDFI